MAAIIIEPASVTIPLLGTNLDERGMIENASVVSAIRALFAALQKAVASASPLEAASFEVR
jgi:hypothetical protein